MKFNTMILIVVTIMFLGVISCTESQVKFKNKFSVILNALGNVMILIALLFAIQFANLQNVILLAPNPKTQFVTSNAKNHNAR